MATAAAARAETSTAPAAKTSQSLDRWFVRIKDRAGVREVEVLAESAAQAEEIGRTWCSGQSAIGSITSLIPGAARRAIVADPSILEGQKSSAA